jgi:hypothetical protein
MSAKDRAPRRLCDLPPEELERRARLHVDGFFGETCAAAERLRTEFDPLNLVRKHPVAAAAAIGVAGFVVARWVRGSRRAPGGAAARPAGPPESVGRTFSRSLLAALAGAAATALPELLLPLLRRAVAGRAGEPEA